MGQDLYEDLADVSADSLSAKLEQALAQRNDRAVLEAAVAHLRAIVQNIAAAMQQLLQQN